MNSYAQFNHSVYKGSQLVNVQGWTDKNGATFCITISESEDPNAEGYPERAFLGCEDSTLILDSILAPTGINLEECEKWLRAEAVSEELISDFLRILESIKGWLFPVIQT